MGEPKQSLYLSCDCSCSTTLVIEKWDENDFVFSIQDSRAFENKSGLLGRLKNAIKILFGKPVYYTEIWINNSDKFKNLVDGLQKLL